MTTSKFIPAFCGALAIGAMTAFAPAAQAQEMGNLHYYQLSDQEKAENLMEWRNFVEYNQHREPCQGYQHPPAGFIMKDCKVYRPQPAAAPAQITWQEPVAEKAAPVLLPSIASYVIHFDFDKSNVRPSEKATLDDLAQDITRHNPTQVTVAGHADTVGAADYNNTLSRKRATAVVDALATYGIKSEVIDLKAYGEQDLAVPTADNVKEPANRRVVIDFRK